MNADMCRVCLSESVGMHLIRNTKLQGVYEKLSNAELIVEDGRPETVCHTCCLHLQRCYDFSIMSQKADHMLTQLYRDDIKISSEAVAALRKTLVSLSSMQPASPDHCAHEVTAPVNDHPSEEWSVQADVTVKRELDTVKSELIYIEESSITEDFNIEVTPENNENECTKNSTPCSVVVGALLKPETQIKDEKHIELSRKYTSDKTLSSTIDKPYCDRCDKTCALKANIEKQTHACVKRCHNACQLKRPMTSNKEEKSFACDQCSKTYSYSSCLKKHMLTHTTENSYVCPECNTSFGLQGTLQRHIVRSHDGEKSHRCDKCGKTFIHKANLKAHIKIHVGEKLSACDRCGKTFPNVYQLKRHMRSHTGEKPFACEQCDKTFSDRGNLKKHVMKHTGKKTYICAECNASFIQKGNLRRHMRCHTGEKPFLCDICQKSLSDASLLRRHMRIHTGEKPYVCDACGKAYSDKDNFKKHMRLHTGEKPYVCKLCDYKSAYANCLKLHVAKKHIRHASEIIVNK